jgi:Calcineurin-like phosphoesterase superfamily domain
MLCSKSVRVRAIRPPSLRPDAKGHDLQELQLDPALHGVDVVISGHSHRPRIETIDGVLYLNPGSAGPWRFKLPVALATLELNASASGHSFTILATPSDRTRGASSSPSLVTSQRTLEQDRCFLELQLETITVEPHLMDPARASRYILDQLLPEPAQ